MSTFPLLQPTCDKHADRSNHFCRWWRQLPPVTTNVWYVHWPLQCPLLVLTTTLIISIIDKSTDHNNPLCWWWPRSESQRDTGGRPATSGQWSAHQFENTPQPSCHFHWYHPLLAPESHTIGGRRSMRLACSMLRWSTLQSSTKLAWVSVGIHQTVSSWSFQSSQ